MFKAGTFFKISSLILAIILVLPFQRVGSEKVYTLAPITSLDKPLDPFDPQILKTLSDESYKTLHKKFQLYKRRKKTPVHRHEFMMTKGKDSSWINIISELVEKRFKNSEIKIDILKLRFYKESPLVEIHLTLKGKYFILVAGSQREFKKIFNEKEDVDNKFPPFIKSQKYHTEKIKQFEYRLFEADPYLEHVEWQHFFASGEGRFHIHELKDLTTPFGIDVLGTRFGLEDLVQPERLQGRAFELIDSLVNSPELKLKKYWEQVFRAETRSKRRQTTTGVPRPDSQIKKVPKRGKIDLVIKTVKYLDLVPSQIEQNTLSIPENLFRQTYQMLDEATLKFYKDFFGRHGVRQMTWRTLYGYEVGTLPSPRIVQTLILLDTIQDFRHFEQQDRNFISMFINYFLLPEQIESFRNILDSFRQENPKEIDEEVIEQVYQFVSEQLGNSDDLDELGPYRTKELEEISQKWQKHNAIYPQLKQFFEKINSNKPAEEQLKYLSILVWKTSRELRNYLSFYDEVGKSIEELKMMKKSREKKALALKVEQDLNHHAVDKIELVLSHLLNHTSIRKEDFDRIRRLLYESLSNLAIQKDPKIEDRLSDFYQKVIEANVDRIHGKKRDSKSAGSPRPRKIVVSQYLVQQWVEVFKEHLESRLKVALAEDDKTKREKYLKNKVAEPLERFEADLKDYTSFVVVDYHYSIFDILKEIKLKQAQAKQEGEIQSRLRQKLQKKHDELTNQLIGSIKINQFQLNLLKEAYKDERFNFELFYNAVVRKDQRSLDQIRSILLAAGERLGFERDESLAVIQTLWDPVLEYYEVQMRHFEDVLVKFVFIDQHDLIFTFQGIREVFQSEDVTIGIIDFYKIMTNLKDNIQNGKPFAFFHNQELLEHMTFMNSQKDIGFIREALFDSLTLIDSKLGPVVLSGEVKDTVTPFERNRLSNGELFFSHLMEEPLNHSHREKVRALIKDALEVRFVAKESIEGKSAELKLTRKHFYELMMILSDDEEIRFNQTEMYSYLKNNIMPSTANEEFLAVFRRFAAVKILEASGLSQDYSTEELFELYSSILSFEQGTDLVPENKFNLRSVIEEKVKERLKPKTGLVRSILGLSAKKNGFSEYDKAFYQGVQAAIGTYDGESEDRKRKNYSIAADQFYKLVKNIIPVLLEEERRKYVQTEIEGKNLSEEQKYLKLNEFYARPDIQAMRLRYKSALAMLAYMLEENKAKETLGERGQVRAIGNEVLDPELIDRISKLLEMKRVKGFLKNELPRIEKLKVNHADQEGANVEAKDYRVYDFLEMSEMGKEFHFQLIKYSFFENPALYNFMGYNLVEVPGYEKDDRGNKEFRPKKYVSKVAFNEFVIGQYAKNEYITGSEESGRVTTFDENQDRFKDNDKIERFVNEFIRAFQKYLTDYADAIGKKVIQTGEELRLAQIAKDAAQMLIVPEMASAKLVLEGDDGENPVRYLLIGYVPGLEVKIPKSRYQNKTDKEGKLLEGLDEVDTTMEWFNNLVPGLIAQRMSVAFYERLQNIPLEREKEEEEKFLKLLPDLTQEKFNTLKALSAVINVMLRNADLQIFLSGTSLVILDMEAVLPMVFSSKFNMDIQEGDKLPEDQGMYDPRRDLIKPVSIEYVWRLNNALISSNDNKEKYILLARLMQMFLSELKVGQKIDIHNFSVFDDGTERKVARALKQNESTLIEDVVKLVESDGTTFLNVKGDVLHRVAEVEPSGVLLKLKQGKGESPGKTISEGSSEEGSEESSEESPKESSLKGSASGRYARQPERPTGRMRFVDETAKLEIHISEELRNKMRHEIGRMRKSKKPMFKLLFGEKKGNTFVIRSIQPDAWPQNGTRKVGFVKSIEEGGTMGVYLGKWIVYSPQEEEDFEITDSILENLPSKESPERLTILVTRLGSSDGAKHKAYGIPSEGLDKESEDVKLKRTKENISGETPVELRIVDLSSIESLDLPDTQKTAISL